MNRLIREEHEIFYTLTSVVNKLKYEEGRPTPLDDPTKFFNIS